MYLFPACNQPSQPSTGTNLRSRGMVVVARVTGSLIRLGEWLASLLNREPHCRRTNQEHPRTPKRPNIPPIGRIHTGTPIPQSAVSLTTSPTLAMSQTRGFPIPCTAGLMWMTRLGGYDERCKGMVDQWSRGTWACRMGPGKRLI